MLKRKNLPQVTAAVLCLLSVAVMIAALSLTGGKKQAEFTPPPFEDSAMSGVPGPDGANGYRELDCEVYKIGVSGDVILENGALDVYLTNLEENNVWLKLRVLDEDGNILGETGLIRPGEYVRSVKIQKAPPLGSPIHIKVMGYEPETYYSAGAVTLTTTLTEGGSK